MRSSTLWSATAWAVILVGPLAAREWTDSTGQHKTEAEFVELDQSQLRLKKPDGRVVSIPLDRLSIADQVYAIREARRRETVIPKLSDKGQQLARELVASVQAAMRDYAGKQDIEEQDWEAKIRPAVDDVLRRCQNITAVEGYAASGAVAISLLLGDQNVAVRALGVVAAEALGDAAIPAAPALVQRLGDPSAQIQEHVAGTLFRMSTSTDAVIPAVVQVLGGTSDLEAARRATHCLASSFFGPRGVAAVGEVASLVLEAKLPAPRRVLAAQTLRLLLEKCRQPERDPRLGPLLEQRPDYQGEDERQLLQRQELISATCRKLLPGLADQDNRVRAVLLGIVCEFQPDALASLSDEKFSELVEQASSVQFDDERFSSPFQASSPMEALSSASANGQLPARLTGAAVVKFLQSEDESLRQFAQTQLAQMGGKAGQILPDLAKLLDHSSPAIRTSAVQLLSSPALTDRENLAPLPSMSVRVAADKDGAVQSIQADDAPVGLPQLAATIAAYRPSPARSAADVDAALEKACNDSDNGVRYLAIQGLMARGTRSSIAVLEKLSQRATRPDMREMARQTLEAYRRQLQEEAQRTTEAPAEASPFSESATGTAPDWAVLLALDPNLRMEFVAAILRTVREARVTGIRLVPFETASASPWELQLHLPKQWQFGEPSLRVKLSQEPGRAAPSILARLESMRRWQPAPSLESLQFLLVCTLRSQEDYQTPQYLPRGLDAQPVPLGARALHYLAQIEFSAELRYDQFVKTLSAIGSYQDDQSQPRDLVQWLKFSVGGETTPLWYLRVAKPR